MRLIAITFALLLSSCSAEFRAPLCEEGKFDFPEQYTGVYRVNIPSTDLNGDFHFANLDFYWGKNSMTIMSHEAIPESGTLRFSSGPPFNVNIDEMLPKTSLCRIAQSYYIQNRTSNDLFSLTRIEFSESGMTFTLVSADQLTLSQSGIMSTHFPSFSALENFDGASGLPFNFFSGPTSIFVVDNRGVAPERIEPLLKPLPLTYFIQKVGARRKDLKEAPFTKTFHF